MSNGIQTLASFEAVIPKLDDAAAKCADLSITKTGAFAEVFALAGATTELRTLLSDDLIQAAIVPLAGSHIGFVTDKDTRGGYPITVVRDVCIWAMLHGARMIGNEVNIIAGRGYLTKEYFLRKLSEVEGLAYRFNHSLPNITPDGATVKTRITWKLGDEAEQTEVIERFITGGGRASADMYLGKMDRKAGAFLYSQVTGKTFADGNADEVVQERTAPIMDVKASPIEAPVAAPDPEQTAPAAADNSLGTDWDIAIATIRRCPEDVAMAFLVKIGWLEDGQAASGLTDDHLAKIASRPEEFISQAQSGE